MMNMAAMKNGSMGILKRTIAPKFGVVMPTMNENSNANVMDIRIKELFTTARNMNLGPTFNTV